MKTTLKFVLAALLCSLMAIGVGCSGCAEDDPAGTNNQDACPDGIVIDGECIRGTPDVGDTSGQPDVGDPEDTSEPDDTDAPQDTARDDVGSEDSGGQEVSSCTPLEVRCASATEFETCNDDGTGFDAPQSCAQGQICRNGLCLVGEQCEPGEAFGCRSPNSQRVCAANGVSYEEQLCPASAPNCFDGQCIAGQCLPDAVFCEGTDLKVCNADGDGSTVQESCPAGCFNGACLQPPDDECGGKSYIGCDFFAVDLDNYARPCTSNFDCGSFVCKPNGVCQGEDANAQQYAVTVSNTSSNNVDIEIFNGQGNIAATGTVAPNALETFALPEQSVEETSLSNRSYRVQASGPVTVHQFNPESNVGVFSNDASLLLPSNALGDEYLFLGWPTLTTPPGATSSTLKSYVTIVAASPGQTIITVDTPVTIAAGQGVTQIPAGTTRNFALTEGQVLQLATTFNSTTEFDLTGMEITANQNIAVFSAHECAVVPTNSPFCDHIEQQLVPVNTWGTEYVSPKFSPRGQEPDVFRVLSAVDGNQITTTPSIAGVDGQTLNRGEFLEFESTQSFVLSATQKVSVGQFMVGSYYPGPDNRCDAQGAQSNCKVTLTAQCDRPGGLTDTGKVGDPAFTLNVPTNQFRQDYFVLTPEGYSYDYVSVVHPPGLVVNMDGSPVSGTTNAIAGTSWEVTWVEIDPGAHKFDANQPFGLYAYGYSCDVSYAYPGGLDLASTP